MQIYRFPYQLKFMLLIGSTAGVSSVAGTDTLSEYLRSPQIFAEFMLLDIFFPCSILSTIGCIFLALYCPSSIYGICLHLWYRQSCIDDVDQPYYIYNTLDIISFFYTSSKCKVGTKYQHIG